MTRTSALVIAAMSSACAGNVSPTETAQETNAPCPPAAPILADQPSADSLAAYAPVVIATWPQAGDQAVDPELTSISVTFSKNMLEDRWSWGRVDEALFPEVSGDPVYTTSRTVELPVTLEPDHTYVVWVNTAARGSVCVGGLGGEVNVAVMDRPRGELAQDAGAHLAGHTDQAVSLEDLHPSDVEAADPGFLGEQADQV